MQGLTFLCKWRPAAWFSCCCSQLLISEVIILARRIFKTASSWRQYFAVTGSIYVRVKDQHDNRASIFVKLSDGIHYVSERLRWSYIVRWRAKWMKKRRGTRENRNIFARRGMRLLPVSSIGANCSFTLEFIIPTRRRYMNLSSLMTSAVQTADRIFRRRKTTHGIPPHESENPLSPLRTLRLVCD